MGTIGGNNAGPAKQSLEGLSDSQPAAALELLSKYVDEAWTTDSVINMRHALGVIQTIDINSWSPDECGRLAYIEANVHSDLFAVDANRCKSQFPLVHEHLDGQLLGYRRAILRATSGSNCPEWVVQAYTNLGNILHHIGRPVDAFQAWNRALSVDSTFPMALANRGIGYIHYGQTVPHSEQARILVAAGLRDLSRGLQDTARLEAGAAEHFAKAREHAIAMLDGYDWPGLLAPRDHTLGQTEDEQTYRQWCLNKVLFLNPLNDIGTENMAARDTLAMPTMTSQDYQPGEWIALFNQIKQEFVSARYLFYEGVTTHHPHFSDFNVLLMNPLDYPVYSLASEKLKAAYRICYSILDRIALLVDDYLELGHDERRLSFKALWHEDARPSNPIHETITNAENRPLRGLYWLSRDLFERNKQFRESLLPEARDLEEIRNALEHRMLRLHSIPCDDNAASLFPLRRRLGHSLAFEHMGERTLQLFRLVRAAIIYAVLAIAIEEYKKRTTADGIGLRLPVVQDTWEDNWKAPW